MHVTSIAIQRRIQYLVQSINDYRHRYHHGDISGVLDSEYNMMLQELKVLEHNHPDLVDLQSPTRVLFENFTSKSSISHQVAMLSLENVYTDEQCKHKLNTWRKLDHQFNGECIVEPKIDGVSLSTVYINGELADAVTRGDGVSGDSVLSNAYEVIDIPKKLISQDKSIPVPDFFECRGEVYIRKDDFQRINNFMLKNNKRQFKNSRNLVSGTLLSKDAMLVKKRHLRFIVHSMGKYPKDSKIKTYTEFINLCQNFSFSTLESFHFKAIFNHASTFKRHYHIRNEREKFQFEIDGSVIKVNDLSSQNKIGNTNLAVRWAFAYKFPAMRSIAIVHAVEFSVSRTGSMVPVAKIFPTECGGVTIQSISLYNLNEIRRLALKIGDTVEIERAGDVIPKIAKVLSTSSAHMSISYPSLCPSCGSKLIHDSEGGLSRCIATDCFKKIERCLLHFVSTDGMNIKGIGVSIASELVQKKFIQDVFDIYHLNREMCCQLKLFSDTKTNNLLRNIQKSKIVHLEKFLFALGIRYLGKRNIKILFHQYPTIESISHLTYDELIQLNGFGEACSSYLASYIKNELQNILIKLNSAGIMFTDSVPKNFQNNLSQYRNKNFV